MKLAIDTSRVGGAAPNLAVARPHVVPLVSAMWMLAAVVSGCSSSDSQVTHPSIVGMTDTTPPYYSVGQTTLYEVQLPVPMPMRAPNAAELAKLGKAPAYLASFGATTSPWIRVDDVQTTLRVTMTNLDDATRYFELLVDPANPYVQYKPGVEIVSDEQTTPDLSGFDRYFVLTPKQRLLFTLVPDDTRELAMDLATVMDIQSTDAADPDGNGLFNHAFNVQNRSGDVDPLIQSFIQKPEDVPAMTGFVIGLRSITPMNIAVEVTVDVQDIAGKRVMPADGTTSADNQPLAPAGATLAPPKVTPQM